MWNNYDFYTHRYTMNIIVYNQMCSYNIFLKICLLVYLVGKQRVPHNKPDAEVLVSKGGFSVLEKLRDKVGPSKCRPGPECHTAETLPGDTEGCTVGRALPGHCPH